MRNSSVCRTALRPVVRSTVNAPPRRLAGLILAAGVSLAAIAPAHATTLFTDSFQGTLSQWSNPAGAGEIVAAPGGGAALTFDQLQGGSLNFLTTLSAFTSSTGSFTISFDIYANCGHTSGCGAFLWANGSQGLYGWALSDTYFSPSTADFADSPGWETVSYTFAGTSTSLGFEDWNGSPYGQAYPSADAIYIRDLTLTDNPGSTSVGTLTVSSVPEPASLAVLVTGLLGLGAGRIRLRRTVARIRSALTP